VAYFEVPSRNLHGETQEYLKILRIASVIAEFRTCHLPNKS
jgi:hypothetical protein